jgi:hypothetical protein
MRKKRIWKIYEEPSWEAKPIQDGLGAWIPLPFDPALLPEDWSGYFDCAGNGCEILISLPKSSPTFHEKEWARRKARKARKRAQIL